MINTETESLLSIRNVSNTYITQAYGGLGRKEEKPVLDHISLEIAPGEIFGLVGESGCGKTTLGRCILGLIDYEGEIIIDGLRQDRKRRRRKAMAKTVQAVFQDPAASLNPAKRVGWLLEEPLRQEAARQNVGRQEVGHLHGTGGKQERLRRVDEVLELVGLESAYKYRRVNELSVGQKQRISIGCALMLRPKLIIADEPVSSLDVSVGAQILNLFRDLHQQLGLSLLFISHNLDLVYYLCDMIAVMEAGQIVETGTAEGIYSSPKHEYTRKLLEAGSPASPALNLQLSSS
ncbi:hypothetical protein FACS189473_3440 [Spirochaetia bacterium]|nr:hypothetical protein FACS189473_3440 [Spirochaetia bacterium]